MAKVVSIKLLPFPSNSGLLDLLSGLFLAVIHTKPDSALLLMLVPTVCWFPLLRSIDIPLSLTQMLHTIHSREEFPPAVTARLTIIFISP